MSKPEDITVSLEMAKKLKEAGWLQNGSVHQWYRNTNDNSVNIDHRTILALPINKVEVIVDAPTAEEILTRLPKETSDDNFLTISPEKNGWAVYYETSNNLPVHTCKADTLANAAASMWIYLKENNLLPPTP